MAGAHGTRPVGWFKEALRDVQAPAGSSMWEAIVIETWYGSNRALEVCRP